MQDEVLPGIKRWIHRRTGDDERLCDEKADGKDDDKRQYRELEHFFEETSLLLVHNANSACAL